MTELPAGSVQRMTLGLGLLGTAMVGALLFVFKSSWTWPISLLWIAAVGLGWACLLGFALERQRREHAASLRMAGEATRACVVETAEAVAETTQRTSADLKEVDVLLSEAIERLTIVFNGIAARSQSDQNAAPGLPVDRQGDEWAALADSGRLNDDLTAAVTAMQFRDVAGQKLDHARAQLDALEAVAQAIAAAAAESMHQDLAQRVTELWHRTRQARVDTPVSQQSMQAGEIELF